MFLTLTSKVHKAFGYFLYSNIVQLALITCVYNYRRGTRNKSNALFVNGCLHKESISAFFDNTFSIALIIHEEKQRSGFTTGPYSEGGLESDLQYLKIW